MATVVSIALCEFHKEGSAGFDVYRHASKGNQRSNRSAVSAEVSRALSLFRRKSAALAD